MDELRATTMLSLAETAGRELKGLDAKASLDHIEPRYPELELAFAWLLEHDRADDALRMTVALAPFWTATHRIPDGRAWFDRSLAAATIGHTLRARALFENGLLAFWQGDDEAANSLHQQSLDIARGLGAPTEAALALSGLARVALRTDVDRARALSNEALATVRGTDDREGRSNAFHLLGVAAQMRGDLEEAREYMRKRVDIARELGNFSAVSGEAANLSVVERQLGNLDHAEELALEALWIDDRRQDEWAIPYSLNALAGIAVEAGDFQRGAVLLGAAVGMMEVQGASWPPDERPHFERSKAVAEEALEAREFERAWTAGRGLSPAGAVAYARA